MKRYISEFIGTFALVFTGTDAIIVNDFSKGAITGASIYEPGAFVSSGFGFR